MPPAAAAATDSCTHPPTLDEEVSHYEIVGLVLLGNLWEGGREGGREGGKGEVNTTLAISPCNMNGVTKWALRKQVGN